MNNIKKIAVFLDGNYTVAGGMTRTALMLCSALLERYDHINVVFGANIPEQNAVPLIPADLRSRFSVTDLSWAKKTTIIGRNWVRPYSLTGYDFSDCDLWIFFNFPSTGVIAPLKPIAAFCADLLTRIVPQAMELSPNQEHKPWKNLINCFLSYRQAALVFSTTPRTLGDVIAYAGVPKANTCLAPQFPPSGSGNDIFGENPVPWERYFLWTSNDTAHKNHERAFQVLDKYYADPHSPKIPVVLTGIHTEYFNPDGPGTSHQYHLIIRDFLKSRPHILKNIYFAGSLNRPVFNTVMKNAEFLWHNVIYDNGTASVFEAAEYGVPSLVTDYPQSRFFDNKYGTNATFFSPFDINDGVKKLQAMTSPRKRAKPGLVSIDYAVENKRFSRWLSDFLEVFDTIPTKKKKTRLCDRLRSFWYLSDVSAYVLPSIRPYLRRFPFGDTTNIGLIITSDNETVATAILQQFEKSLRQDYNNYKLLIALQVPKNVADSIYDYIKYNVLGFDFIILTNNNIQHTFGVIDRYCARVYSDIPHITGIKTDKIIPIMDIGKIREEMNAFVPSQNETRTNESTIATDRRITGQTPFFFRMPKIPTPKSALEFIFGDGGRYIISGLYGRERRAIILGFRWAANDVNLILSRQKSSRKFFYILAQAYTGYATMGRPTPSIEIFIEGKRFGAFELRSGLHLYRLELRDLNLPEQELSKVRLRCNYSYSASICNPRDSRYLSWQAHAIGFGSTLETYLVYAKLKVITTYLRFYEKVTSKLKRNQN